ncbi:MAG: RluA family pseudouridine synthase [Clostridia bacterium]|nr:RluA family pseudouridine synthase [Clostridia bacterium]
MREFEIKRNDAGQRLDKFITKATDIPQSLLYKSIRLKKIKVNRKRCEPGTVLTEGDLVQCFVADSFFKNESETGGSLDNISVSLNIIYEDENLILVDKRPGISVHEDEHGKNNTLINLILAYLYQKGEYDPKLEQSFTPALCNRIDRNTGGIVIAAKNAESLRVMNEKIKLREIDKFYLAAVHGVPKKKSDTLTGYLIKDEKSNTVRVYDKNPPRQAKSIATKYTVISERGGDALVEVELLTGRTHQIRAHMAHVGHPLIGDGKYGVNREDRKKGYKYQALYSYKLRFSFKGEPTVLEYLNGKEFKINKRDIYFTEEFFK